MIDLKEALEMWLLVGAWWTFYAIWNDHIKGGWLRVPSLVVNMVLWPIGIAAVIVTAKEEVKNEENKKDEECKEGCNCKESQG